MRVTVQWLSDSDVTYTVEGDADDDGARVDLVYCECHGRVRTVVAPAELDSMRAALSAALPAAREAELCEVADCDGAAEREERGR